MWEGLRDHVDAEELRRYWSPISPYPYVGRMRDSTQKMLMVAGSWADLTFLPEFVKKLSAASALKAYRRRCCSCLAAITHSNWPLRLPCGPKPGQYLFRNLLTPAHRRPAQLNRQNRGVARAL